MTWDTEELIRWIDNDEILYLAGQGGAGERTMELYALFCPHADIDPSEVDWDAIKEHVNA